MSKMTPLQLAAFWVWYRSFNGGRKRSIRLTSERIGIAHETIRLWHRLFGWDDLAVKQDAEVNSLLNKRAVEEIVRTFDAALERQRAIVTALYRRFEEVIPTLPADQFRVADLIKLMEFETQFIFDEDRGKEKGSLLGAVLAIMPPEERTKFHGFIERARDSGRLQLARVGSPSRN